MRHIAEELPNELFDAVVNLFSSFGFYDDETSREMLAQCLRMVRPDGIFMLDTLNRDWLMRNFRERAVEDHGELLTVEKREFDLERAGSKSHWTILEQTDASTWETALEVDVAIRIYTLHELIELFESAGWFFVESFGSLAGEPFELGSKRLVGVFKTP